MTKEWFRPIEKSVVAFGMRQFLRIRELYPQGQDYFDKVVLPAMIAGEKRWPSQDAAGLLQGYEIEVEGQELIPEQGIGLVIINHWGAGPLRHWWPDYWMDLVTAQKTGKDTRWIFQDALEMKIAGVGLKTEVPIFSQMQRLFVDTYKLVAIPTAFRRKANSAAIFRMIKDFAKGDILGLAPETRESIDLAPGNSDAGKLTKTLAKVRPEALVLPVRASSCREKLYLNVGKTYHLQDLVAGSDQTTANNLMTLIRELKALRS